MADGSVVIHTQPVGGEINNHLLGYMGENPNAYQESSRIISHVRHLSTVSQWLVCVALLLCLISMLAISIAILKQIKARRYHNLRTIVPAQVIVPGQLGEPIPAKKIPLGSSPSAAEPNTYPLIHDSPPPAYDQLSIHKEQPTDAVGAGAGHEETIPEKEPTAHRDDTPNNDDGSHHPNA
ncbi:unnamed protein product [Anisakis simplex]|uniref:Uncharacterized protein n=1 Tax=Anisakis simplex TaxID=6269 RepID=A0A3P6N1U6_ANISI|nr:unnamed protein product [Anisakis simplex]